MALFSPLQFVDESTHDYLNYLLQKAIEARASDIHLEPLRHALRVRFRVDGRLYEFERLPNHLKPNLLAYVKIRSQMDIAQTRLPQDGRFEYQLQGPWDIRASLIPTIYGESIALRLLNPSQLCLYFSELGFLDDHDKTLQALIHQAGGMLLFCGPTGSGKTTTLYSILNYLQDGRQKMITLEDPIEYHLEGVHQVAVHPGIGLSFANSLRAILRQAPDLIMIGEIRDPDTIHTAINAAITGHKVLSTLHTDDTISALLRLLDLGIPSFLMGSAISGIVAQRLMRCVCPHCAETAAAPIDSRLKPLLADEAYNFKEGRGCEQCRFTGFLGRIGVFEILPVKPALIELLSLKASYTQLQGYLKAHKIRSLAQDALLKAQRGISPLSEVMHLLNQS